MTSSNGNIFRVTGPLCGEFTGHRWIPLSKASDVELWCFLWSVPWIKGWVNKRQAGDLRRHRAHYDVIVMNRSCLERWSADIRVHLHYWWNSTHTEVKPSIRQRVVMAPRDNGNMYMGWQQHDIADVSLGIMLNSSALGQNGRHFCRRPFEVHFLEWK